MKLYEYGTIDSTFVESGRIAPGLDEGQYLFLAERQTEGKGQGDHSFESPAGNGIYATLLLRRPKLAPERLRLLTPLAAVCVTREIRSQTEFGSRLSVRFVNDLMLDGKKYGGILSAATFDGNTVLDVRIGFGINTGDCDVGEKIGVPTESIRIYDAEKRRDLALSCAESIAAAATTWDESRVFDEYSGLCRMENFRVIMPDGSICRCGNTDPDFSLNVTSPDGKTFRLYGTSGVRFI